MLFSFQLHPGSHTEKYNSLQNFCQEGLHMNPVSQRILSAASFNSQTQTTGMVQCPARALPLTSGKHQWGFRGFVCWFPCLLLPLAAWNMENWIQAFYCLALVSTKFPASPGLRICWIACGGVFGGTCKWALYEHVVGTQLFISTNYLLFGPPPPPKHLLRQGREEMSFAMATQHLLVKLKPKWKRMAGSVANKNLTFPSKWSWWKF